MSSRAKRFAVMALAVVLALALALGVAPIFGGMRNALAAAEVLTLDFDGTQVTMDVKSGVDADNLFGVFAGNDGSTKLAYTSDAVEIDGTIKLTLATPVSGQRRRICGIVRIAPHRRYGRSILFRAAVSNSNVVSLFPALLVLTEPCAVRARG